MEMLEQQVVPNTAPPAAPAAPPESLPAEPPALDPKPAADPAPSSEVVTPEVVAADSDSDDDLELEGLIACQETTFHEAPPPPRSPSPAGPDYAGLADLSRERLACRVAEAGGDGAAIRTSWAVAARPGVGRAAVAYTTTAPCGRTFGSCCADDVLEFLDLAPKKRRTPPRAEPRPPPPAPKAPKPRAAAPTPAAPRPDDEPATYDGVVYRMGERVRARYNRGSVAYGALVARVYREADGPLYDLVYDDGFRDARLPARFIRDVVRASPLEIRRADSRDWIFFESQAIALRQLGPLLTQQMLLRLLHSKAWDDDPFRARRVDAKAGVKIRNARDREQDDDFRPNRAVGDPVLAQYDRAGIFYKGTISKVHDGGRAYDVRYEDGDEELDIDAYYVLDADDPRGAEGVEGLDGLVEAEPPRPAKQAKKRPRDEKPAKKKDRDETFPRPPRPVEVRRRGSDAWTHFASLSKAAKHYKNLPAWLVQRLVSDPTLKHDVFECRAADAAPPPAKKARGACEAGAVVVLRSGGCWRRGVADGEGAVAFEDGKTRAVDAADVGLAVLGGGAPVTADGEAVPEAWLLDAADLVGRAVARVEQGRPSLGRVAAVDADDDGARPCVRVQWSGAAAPKRLHLDAFRAKLDDGALAVADAPEAGAVAALRAENARLRAALDAR
ncbi:hypothetical protein AURANDRAFT_65257 [Aureococcus anophagefferens]|uniref:Tudor domain-containing protein n=2 Tax=Aureococcus anophagefferens TaxID=44056 RepID=F0YD94_AURAN|nr:hypothetical protein AURANDRAFT_65257 [Aureococcus anophagefferens]EGB07022.1 hypothetical protein AURANDRAFT_65257 [Aureococcus anophagefferens]|eukprot:XP_009038259.1 hypothetical protein AURANDRAFT_65257 [Aureococcus anophagefferens]